MRISFLSNLVLRSNLLSGEYQQEIPRISVLEVKDIWRRNPMLRNEDRLTSRQRQEWTEHLFWGRREAYMKDDGRTHCWIEVLANEMDHAVAALENRPEAEDAFELLVVTEQLRRYWRLEDKPDSTNRVESEFAGKVVEVDDWNERIRAVLRRPEFHLSQSHIDDRLNQVLGFPLEPVSERPEVPQSDAAIEPMPLEEQDQSSDCLEPSGPEGNELSSGSPPLFEVGIDQLHEPQLSALTSEPGLQRIIAAWSTLPDHVRNSILLLVEAAHATAHR